MLEHWPFFTAAFLGFAAVGLLIYMSGSRRRRVEGWKNEAYTCGEPFPSTPMGPQNFYSAVRKNLRIDELRRMHSGRLSEYLLWMVVGIVAVLIMVLFL